MFNKDEDIVCSGMKVSAGVYAHRSLVETTKDGQ